MTAATMNILDGRVLVLNKEWHPVNVTKVWKAIQKVWKERAVFIDPATHHVYDFEGWVESWDDAVKVAREAELEVALMSGDEAAFEAIVKKSGESLIHEDGFIRVGSLRIRSPEIIACTEYKGMAWKQTKRRPKFSRVNVFRRDKCVCAYCNKRFKPEDLTMEHVIPRAQGGLTTWKNIALACIPCNSRKKDRTPKEAGMRLLHKPFVPKAKDVALNPHERLMRRIGGSAPKTWEQFLGKMFMNVELTD